MVKTEMKLITWQTYKENYKPEIWTCRDGSKHWLVEKFQPTMKKQGYRICSCAGYALENVREIAKKLLLGDTDESFDYSFTYGNVMDKIDTRFPVVYNVVMGKLKKQHIGMKQTREPPGLIMTINRKT